jgi:hypothetical protein
MRTTLNRRLALGLVPLVAALAGAAVVAQGGGAPAGPSITAKPPLAEIMDNLRAVQLRDPVMYRQMVITLKATNYLPRSFEVPTPEQARRLTSFRIAALSAGRAPTAEPAEVRAFVLFASRATRTPRDTALARLRVLRRALGARSGDVYAFASNAGGPCFILTGQGGACALASLGTRGFAWTIGGGGDAIPSSLVGIVADDVVGVQLNVDNRSVPVDVTNNVAFAEFPATASVARMVVTYSDASPSTETVSLR